MDITHVTIPDWWPPLVAAVGVALSVFLAGHAVLYKRDVRAAWSWALVIMIAPYVGALAYAVLGVNRIRRRATRLRPERADPGVPPALPEEALRGVLRGDYERLIPLARLLSNVSHRPLTVGNRVQILCDGDEAYPAMLDAIRKAERSISLCTYIFDNDVVGRSFADALGDAKDRGVEVRVLIDAVGLRYGFPSILGALRRRGLPVARFLPARVPWRLAYMNLRNHRKVMVVDGRLGFTGGINIRAGHLIGRDPRHPVRDMHFELAGPVVRHLQESFIEDWAFAARERLSGDRWLPELAATGAVIARGISDGPDGDFERLRWAFYGGVVTAHRNVRIMTPYFLPDPGLITALDAAALRGVQVDVLIPQRGNLRAVQWATEATLWQILKSGCRVWRTPDPFDHSKVMVVDDAWMFMGSGNWDPRSLRLNFEFNVECYDPMLAKRVAQVIEARRAVSRPHSLADADGRSFPVKLRDSVARMMTPFL